MKSIVIIILACLLMASPVFAQITDEHEIPPHILEFMSNAGSIENVYLVDNSRYFPKLFVSYQFSPEGGGCTVLKYNQKISSFQDIMNIIDVIKENEKLEDVYILYWRRMED